jgi:hypothetical protein
MDSIAKKKSRLTKNFIFTSFLRIYPEEDERIELFYGADFNGS